MKLKFLFALITLFASPALRADILFIDMNDSADEIACAQEAANARGEELIVYPTYSEKIAGPLEAAREKVREARKTQAEACAGKVEGLTCDQARENLANVNDAYEKLAKKAPRVTPAGIKKMFKDLSKQNANISSIVISGEDGNGWFGGLLGDIHDPDIREAMKQNPSIANSVRSFLPWGCYTTALGSTEFRWKGIFPNANMIAGFDRRGPNKWRPASCTVLRDVLTTEDKLTKETDEKERRKLFKGIQHIADVSAGICLSGDTMMTNKATMSIKEEIEKCKQLPEDDREVFSCYHEGRPGCEDVPADTGKSPLRDYYNYIQDTEHCEKALAAMGRKRPLSDEVMRLVFDRNVRNNFASVHAHELRQVDELVKELGYPDLTVSNLGQLPRREFLKRMTQLKKAHQQLERATRNEYGKTDDPAVIELGLAITELRKIGNFRCVPPGWVLANSTQPPQCDTKRNLGSVRRRAEHIAAAAAQGR